MDTRRCIECGAPACDHVPLKYVARVWWRHHFWSLLNRLAR